jgi:hypothetical protein
MMMSPWQVLGRFYAMREENNPAGISVSLQVEHKQFIGNGQFIGSSLG